jgi:hypothetical protein
MPLLTSRNKLVNFRLSEEEYEALKNYCVARKVRSISELARESILQQVYADDSKRNLVSTGLVTLASSFEEIDVALKALSAG